ncbi:MAG: phosphoribosylformylglycinamidine synthase subunit PurL [Deltaproteobacteria bacterium]|nr:phosphoribosylformylglycinamidine synthase subunit PurL [Deltaproteobacteria bacterium]
MSEAKKWSDAATLEDALDHGLTADEFKHLTDLLGRTLNMVELGVCAALYSEHCSYKSTKVHLRNLPTTGKRVIQGPGENAGVVDIGDGQAVVFKVESHNHPTFIEPYQGAATGVGGILRDVFTMGARPLACMNALRFGAPDNPRTPYLLSRAVSGIGGYGNCMGIPTVGGELFFHESYNGNCLVNAFALGLVQTDKIFLGRAAGIGNAIIYLGSKTGRDGIHGATMASEEFDDNSEEKRPTVQVGDPFTEKLLLEACLEVMQTGAVVGIQDMGAAGMTSSTYEMADRAGTGVRIHLDRIPQREANMNPYEIMLSESQERMLLVVEVGRVQEVLDLSHRWELDAVQIGEVVEGKNVDLFWHGELVSSLEASLLTSSVPQYRWPEKAPTDFEQRSHFDTSTIPEAQDLNETWLKMLGSVNLCSRFPVFNQYDSTVRSNTVVHPGGDAAVIRIKAGKAEREKGVAMTLDCNSRYCSIDPRQGAALTLAEACRNIAAVGAFPIGISDNLNFGNPEKPEGMWQISEAIRGLSEAARAFDVPVVSGNVSLYNETKAKPILPTPLLAVVGLIEDSAKCIGIHFKEDGDKVFLIGATDADELGGSEYMAQYAGVEKGTLPELNYDLEIKSAELIRSLIDKGLIRSCHDLSSGGLAIALAESCFGVYGHRGATLELDTAAGRKDGLLFSETGARYLVSCSPSNEAKLLKAIAAAGLTVSAKGTVGGAAVEVKGIAKIDLGKGYTAWSQGLKPLFS